MPSPSWDVSVAWMCLCPFALLTCIFAIAVVFHFRPLLHSFDVAMASLLITMATNNFLLLPIPALIRLSGDLRWNKDACTFYNWLSATLRASNVLALLLMNMYWVASLRTSPDPSSNSPKKRRIFHSSKLMKLAVGIAWVVSIIIGLVPVAGGTRVFDYYTRDVFNIGTCWFLPYDTDIGFALFFIILCLVSLLLGCISSGDTVMLFRHMKRHAVTKYSPARQRDLGGGLPSHVTGIAQDEASRGAHAQYSELNVSRELCLLGLVFTFCSTAVNAFPLVVSQFIQMTHNDYDHVALETTLLWLLLVEAIVLPHLLWAMSPRYRHSVNYLWRVYVKRDMTAKEEDVAAVTLQAYRMKSKEWNLSLHGNGSVSMQSNGETPRRVGETNHSSPGTSGLNGRQKKTTDSSMMASKPAAVASTSTTDLDDGMTALSSLPVYSTPSMPLRDLSTQPRESSPHGNGDVKTNGGVTTVGYVNARVLEVEIEGSSGGTEQETSLREGVDENKTISTPGVWASRIVTRERFNVTDGVGPTSQSTPNTPTKSPFSPGPIPAPRRNGSSSSNGSASYTKVTRSSSATSRQEWKERMRKKHLPAIFVNSSFEEDKTSPSSPQHTQNSANSSPHRINGTKDRKSSNNSLEGVVQGSPERLENSQGTIETIVLKDFQSKVNSSPLHGAPILVTEATQAESRNTRVELTTLREPTLNKQGTTDSEGISGMYDDGDIWDVLDDATSNVPVSKKVTTATQLQKSLSAEKVENVSQDIKEPNSRSQSLTSRASISKEGSEEGEVFAGVQLLPLETKKIHHRGLEQGIENRAFEMEPESNVAELEPHDSKATGFTPAVSVTPSNAEGIIHPLPSERATVLLTDDAILVSLPNSTTHYDEHKPTKSNEDSELASSAESSASYSLPNTNIPRSTDSPVPSISARMRRANFREIVASSNLTVSSVDERDEDESISDDTKSSVQTVRDKDLLSAQSSQDKSSISYETTIDSVSPFVQNSLSLHSADIKSSLSQNSGHPNAPDSQNMEIQDQSKDNRLVPSSGVDDRNPSPEVPSVSQDWGQLETLSGTEVLLLQTKSVRTAAAMRLDSSLEEEDEGEREADTSKDESDMEKGRNSPAKAKGILSLRNSDADSSDGAKRVSEEEWLFQTSNLASFSTQEDLSTVAGVSVNSNVVSQSAPPPYERDGNGDGAESDTDTVKGATPPSFPYGLRNSYLGISDTTDKPVDDTFHVANSKEHEPDLLQSTHQNTPGINSEKAHSYSGPVPKPLPSVTPTLIPVGKPPRGGRRGQQDRVGEVYARLTSSEDELDGIFEEEIPTRKEWELESSPFSYNKKESLEESEKEKVTVHSSNPWNPFEGDNGSHSESNKFGSALQSSGASSDLLKEVSLDLAESTSSHTRCDSDKSDHSVTLEPYGKRHPPWMDEISSDDKLDSSGGSMSWADNDAVFSDPNTLLPYTHSVVNDQRLNNNSRIPQSSTDFRFTPSGNASFDLLQDSHVVSSLNSFDNEEYDFSSVNNTNGADAPAKHRYRKNPRTTSARPLRPYRAHSPQNKDHLSHSLPYTPAAQPEMASQLQYFPQDYEHHLQASNNMNAQPYQQHPLPLVQYHFDDDIDRGFEEALSMDYLPFAQPPHPSHMSTLYVPGASSGLYFESISEEPEDNLSLTELAEVSSQNGDSLFKTQAVISRPSSRGSISAPPDAQNTGEGRSTPRTLTPLTITSSENNSQSSLNAEAFGTGILLRYDDGLEEGPDSLIPTSERTSADGSEATSPPGPNGHHHHNHHHQHPHHSAHSKSPTVDGKNPWVFSDTSELPHNGAQATHSQQMVDFNPYEDPFSNTFLESGAKPVNQNSSPWLEVDMTILTHGDKTSGSEGDLLLDMSFESDFSSENNLAETSLDQSSDKRDQRRSITSSVEPMQPWKRASTPVLLQESSLSIAGANIENQEQQNNIASAYF